MLLSPLPPLMPFLLPLAVLSGRLGEAFLPRTGAVFDGPTLRPRAFLRAPRPYLTPAAVTGVSFDEANGSAPLDGCDEATPNNCDEFMIPALLLGDMAMIRLRFAGLTGVSYTTVCSAAAETLPLSFVAEVLLVL